MNALQTQNLQLGYDKTIIIDKLNLKIPKGKITIFVGGNGCGKSTLLRSLARILKPQAGQIFLDDKSLTEIATKEIAKRLAILPQGPIAPEGLTVLQLIKQGRYPYQSWKHQWSKEDDKIIKAVMKATNIAKLANRFVNSLSGGQRQRAWIAMCLAQNTHILLLDEPTTYLDLAHQIEVLDLLFELNATKNHTIVMVLHDLNLACRYADNIVAIKNKSIYAQGAPEKIITKKMVYDVFNIKCEISTDILFGTPLCIPYGKGRKIPKNTENAEAAKNLKI